MGGLGFFTHLGEIAGIRFQHGVPQVWNSRFAAIFIAMLAAGQRQLDKVIPRAGVTGYPAVSSLSHVVTTRFG